MNLKNATTQIQRKTIITVKTCYKITLVTNKFDKRFIHLLCCHFCRYTDSFN